MMKIYKYIKSPNKQYVLGFNIFYSPIIHYIFSIHFLLILLPIIIYNSLTYLSIEKLLVLWVTFFYIYIGIIKFITSLDIKLTIKSTRLGLGSHSLKNPISMWIFIHDFIIEALSFNVWYARYFNSNFCKRKVLNVASHGIERNVFFFNKKDKI